MGQKRELHRPEHGENAAADRCGGRVLVANADISEAIENVLNELWPDDIPRPKILVEKSVIPAKTGKGDRWILIFEWGDGKHRISTEIYLPLNIALVNPACNFLHLMPEALGRVEKWIRREIHTVPVAR